MNVAIVFLAALLSSFSWAEISNPSQFNGDWKGTGVYQLNGVQTHCPTFELSFDGNTRLMSFLGGTRVCETHSEKFVTVVMAFHDGKLYYDGRVVGTIHGNVLETQFSMPEEGGRVRHWRMSMRQEGDTLVYEESRRMDDEKTPMISFAGILSKK